MIPNFLLAVAVLLASISPTNKGGDLDPDTRKRVIDGVLTRLVERYVYPDKAKAIAKAVREKQAKGEYDAITDRSELARRLTADLRAVVDDRHLRVIHHPKPLPVRADEARPDPAEEKAFTRQFARGNHGLKRVEVLPGNIGYVDVRVFWDPADTADKWAGVFDLLADTDALVLDVRECGGATSDQATPLVCSYLFDEPIHLYSIYWRPTATTRQYWTQRAVSGKKYLNRPVYVLTSKKTFSGAEQIAYDLQAHKRARVVGEASGGGAHPGGEVRVDDHFGVWVPFGRPENPVTKSNWEGVGVKPDVAVPAEKALAAACKESLTNQLAAAEKKKGDKEWADAIRQALKDAERELGGGGK
jgi:C-terminal processing protease CtpA/Prc